MQSDIMLSVHCSSMLAHAEKFRVFLTENGHTVFLCNQMLGGVNYRTEICTNAARCKVFVAFINVGWCNSKECEYEFNIAVGSSLESGSPFIIPILLEDFNVYDQYPAIRGFLRNCNGIFAKATNLDHTVWNRVLTHASGKLPSPASSSPSLAHFPAPSSSSPSLARSPAPSSSSPSLAHLPAPSSSPSLAHSPAPSSSSPSLVHSPPLPYINVLSLSNSSSATATPASPAGSSKLSNHIPILAADVDVNSLCATSLQLIKEIQRYKVHGAQTIFDYLENKAKPTLQNVSKSPLIVTSLIALMDYLSKIKEILDEHKEVPQCQFPQAERVLDTVLKLVDVVENSKAAQGLPARTFIQDNETVTFWETNFGVHEYTTTWSLFESSLKKHKQYSTYSSPDMLQDLRLRLDHYNTGFVVCHRISDFVGNKSLGETLHRYKDKALNRPTNRPPTSVVLPVLLWVDDYPENNDYFVEHAREKNINTVLVKSTHEAKHWLKENPSVFDEINLNNVHIITDNVRSGANTMLDMNAGEDIIRFVRGRRSTIPILVFCRDPRYADYTKKYEECSVATQGGQCQKFIDELASPARFIQ